MKLDLSERIMVLQARSGMDDTALGKTVYKDIKHPNVKIAKIKAKIYNPNRAELERIAHALNASLTDLLGNTANVDEYIVVDEKAIRMFPNLEHFVKMINLAAVIGNKEFAENVIRELAPMLLNTTIEKQPLLDFKPEDDIVIKGKRIKK